jgi:hypothetical protein
MLTEIDRRYAGLVTDSYKENEMNPTRKIAIITGVIFIIATVAALLAAGVDPILAGTDYLSKVSAHASQVAADAFLYLIAAFTSVGIAIALYPVLKERNAGLAIGSVVFRTVEAVFYMVAVVSLLSVLTLSQQLSSAGAADGTSLQAIGAVLLSLREHASLAAVFAFSLGACMYYTVFFQSRLVPRWLSGWGVIATLLMLTACVLSLFSDNPITGYTLLVLPIALQEMVLAVWLIAKGFSPSAIASGSAKTDPGGEKASLPAA